MRRLPLPVLAASLATAAAVLAGCGDGGAGQLDVAAPSAVAPATTTRAPATTAPDPTGDAEVEIVSCGATGTLAFGQARLRVTNRGAGTATYSVLVAFESTDGTVLAPGAEAIVLDLAAGRAESAIASTGPGMPEDVRCEVVQVNRVPSE